PQCCEWSDVVIVPSIRRVAAEFQARFQCVLALVPTDRIAVCQQRTPGSACCSKTAIELHESLTKYLRHHLHRKSAVLGQQCERGLGLSRCRTTDVARAGNVPWRPLCDVMSAESDSKLIDLVRRARRYQGDT